MLVAKPNFGWRPLRNGEPLPSEYIYWDGLHWVHRKSSPICGEMVENVPNITHVYVKMSEQEIAQFPMTPAIWGELHADDRYLYNRPAFLCAGLVEVLTERGWEQWHGLVSLASPYRPQPVSQARKWWIVPYPGGSAIAFDDKSMAEFACVGTDAKLIEVQETT